MTTSARTLPGAVSIRLVTVLCALVIAAGATGLGAQPASIAGKYSGRYQCGEWTAFDLVITELGGGRVSAEFSLPQERGGGAFSLVGYHDARASSLTLIPQRWTRRAPPGYQLVGMQGLFDPAKKWLTGRINTSSSCGGFELVAEGGTPLPATPGATAPPPMPGAPPGMTGVEYWDASMASDGSGKRVAREAEPIDEVIDWLKGMRYSCVGTQRAIWNAEGTQASTSGDRVDTRETYVIECDGDCRGLRYVPMTDANIQALGPTRPVPVLYMRNMRAGGTPLRWLFARPAGGEPPDVYIHHWNAHSFNRSAGCRAPKASKR